MPEETEELRETASIVPEENQPYSLAAPAPTSTPILPSASDAKKTKAAERAAEKEGISFIKFFSSEEDEDSDQFN